MTEDLENNELQQAGRKSPLLWPGGLACGGDHGGVIEANEILTALI